MKPSPFAAPDSGRLFWREPGEPRDERPTLLIRPFWRDEQEAAAYLIAVRNNPRTVDLERDEIESVMAYLGRIASIVAKTYVPRPGPAWPRASRPHREYTGPREPITEGNLTFEDRTDAIYERQPGEEG